MDDDLIGLMRCGKSCRLRWINYLRPDLKRGNFTKDEEDLIIHFHQTLGNKWSKIASYLPGRTDNEIKNMWNTHLKKRLPSSSSSSSISSKEAEHDKNYDEIDQEEVNKSEDSAHLKDQCMHRKPNLDHELHQIQLLIDYDDITSEFAEQPLDLLLQETSGATQPCGFDQDTNNKESDLWEQMVESSSLTHCLNSDEEYKDWFNFMDNQTYFDDFTLVGEVCL